MSVADDIAKIAEQEKRLAFTAFDEATAFASARRCASARSPKSCRSSIQISVWDRLLFYAALPGSSSSNFDWVRRKINVVKMFQKSTYRMVLEQNSPDRAFKTGHGLPVTDYVLAGGGFPVIDQRRRRGRRIRSFRPAGTRGPWRHRRCALRSSPHQAQDARAARRGRTDGARSQGFPDLDLRGGGRRRRSQRTIRNHLPAKPKGRTIVVGAGKASAQMAAAFEKAWDGPIEGLVVTRYGYAAPCERIEIIEAAHPVPDEAGLAASKRLLEKVVRADARTTSSSR